MVGRDVGDVYKNLKRNDTFGETVLEIENLSSPIVNNVSFKLRKGEILGFAGLVGSGRSEVMRALFGADPVLSGTVKLDGKEVNFKSPGDAIEAGIALCPEDRKEQGLVLFAALDNVCAPVLHKLSRGFSAM